LENATAGDILIRIKLSNNYAPNSSLDKAFGAWNFGVIPGCAWLERRVDSSTDNVASIQFPLKGSVLAVFSKLEFPSRGGGQYFSVLDYNHSYPRVRTPIPLAAGAIRERDRLLHEAHF
jgi:hypothetical protein